MLTEQEIRSNKYYVHKMILIRTQPQRFFNEIDAATFNMMENAQNYRFAAFDECLDFGWDYPEQIELLIGSDRTVTREKYYQLHRYERECRREELIDHHLSNGVNR